jgi:hypothetical protein
VAKNNINDLKLSPSLFFIDKERVNVKGIRKGLERE